MRDKSNIHLVILIDCLLLIIQRQIGDRGGRHRVVVGFTTTCAISVYHH